MIEHRQELWDRQLISGWVENGTMGYVVFWYLRGCGCNAADIDAEGVLAALAGVRRAPRKGYELTIPVRAFFDQALPTSSKALWAGVRGWRIDAIVQNEQRIKASESNKRNMKARALRGRLKAKRQEAETNAIQAHFEMRTRGSHRSDWGTIKRTNNK